MAEENEFDKIVGKDTIGDILIVRTKRKNAVYASVVDHENKVVITKTILEATDTGDFKDILKDLDIDHIDSDDEDAK